MPQKRKHFIRLPEPCSGESLTESLAKARQAGLDGVDWPVSIASMEKYSLEHACELTENVEPIKVGSISTTCTTTDIEAATQQITGALRAASYLGASCLNLTLPSLTPSASREDSDEPGFDRVLEASNFAYALLRSVRFEAEAAGVTIALETAQGRCFHSPVELREMMDALHSWAMGVCVDVTRVSAIGGYADWLETLLYRVHSVRVDLDQSSVVNDGSDQDESMLTRVCKTLREIRYGGALIVSTRGLWRDAESGSWSGVLDHIARADQTS